MHLQHRIGYIDWIIDRYLEAKKLHPFFTPLNDNREITTCSWTFWTKKSLHRKMMYLRLMYDYMDVNLLSILDHLVKLGDRDNYACGILSFGALQPLQWNKNTAIEDVLYNTHHEGNVYLRWGKSMLMWKKLIATCCFIYRLSRLHFCWFASICLHSFFPRLRSEIPFLASLVFAISHLNKQTNTLIPSYNSYFKCRLTKKIWQKGSCRLMTAIWNLWLTQHAH